MVARETRTFCAPDGSRLAYHLVGSGPALVCQPGGPGRASAYFEDLGGLSGTRTLVQLDPRGTGLSEVPADPGSGAVDRLPDDIDALRVELGLDRIDLLGHSAGAGVAQLYADAYSHRLRSLVLLTPPGWVQDAPRSDLEEIRAGRAGEPWYDEAISAQDELSTATPPRRGQLDRVLRPFMYSRWDERAQVHAAGADTQMSPRASLAYPPAGDIDRSALCQRLGRLDLPVLVVAGDRDGVTGVEAPGLVNSTFARSTLVVLPDCGHFPWIDNGPALAGTIAGFLGAVDSVAVRSTRSGRAGDPLILNRRSSRSDVEAALESVGRRLPASALDRVFARSLELAERKPTLTDRDLLALAAEESEDTGAGQVWEFAWLAVAGGTDTVPRATVRLARGDEIAEADATGAGMIDAACNAVAQAAEVTAALLTFTVAAVTSGSDAIGDVTVQVDVGGTRVSARGVSTDVVEASARAFLHAVNKAADGAAANSGG